MDITFNTCETITTLSIISSLPNICFVKYLMDEKDGGFNKEKVVQRREWEETEVGGNSGRNVRKGMQIIEKRKVEIKRDKCEWTTIVKETCSSTIRKIQKGTFYRCSSSRKLSTRFLSLSHSRKININPTTSKLHAFSRTNIAAYV